MIVLPFFLLTIPAFAAGIAIAPPLTGLRPVSSEGASVASNGDGYLAAWDLLGREPVVVPLNAAGQRIGPSVPIPRSCRELFGLGTGYLLGCDHGSPQRSLRSLSPLGTDLGTIEPSNGVRAFRPLSTSRDRILAATGVAGGEMFVMDAGGQVLGTPHPITANEKVIAIPTDSGGFILLTEDYGRPARLFTVSRDGGWTPSVQLPSQVAGVTAGAQMGHDLLVVWPYPRPSSALIAPDGSLKSGPHTLSFTPSMLVTQGQVVTGVGRGAGYEATILGLHLNDSGAPIGSAFLLASAFLKAAASNGRGMYGLSVNQRRFGYEVTGFARDLEGWGGHGIDDVLSVGELDQRNAAIHGAGDAAMVAWLETAADRMWIRAQRLQGAQAIGTVFEIDNTTQKIERLQVSASESSFLVAWLDSVGIHAKRITVAGSVLDLEPLLIPAVPYMNPSFAVASDGTDFMVTWVDQGRLAASALSAGGTIHSPRILSEPAPQLETRDDLTLASMDGKYLLGWTQQQWWGAGVPGPPNRGAGELRRLTFGKEPQAPTSEETIVEPRLWRAKVGYASELQLVVAEIQPAGGSESLGLAVVVSDEKGVLDRHVIDRFRAAVPPASADPWSVRLGSVAWDGGEFVFAFSDRAASYLGRLTPGRRPLVSYLLDPPVDPPVVAATGGGVQVILTRAQRGDGPHPIARLFASEEHNFEAERGRRRAARR